MEKERKVVEVPLELERNTYFRALSEARRLGLSFDEFVRFVIECELFERRRDLLIGRD